jgi:hypothetical protein
MTKHWLLISLHSPLQNCFLLDFNFQNAFLRMKSSARSFFEIFLNPNPVLALRPNPGLALRPNPPHNQNSAQLDLSQVSLLFLLSAVDVLSQVFNQFPQDSI